MIPVWASIHNTGARSIPERLEQTPCLFENLSVHRCGSHAQSKEVEERRKRADGTQLMQKHS